VTLTPPCATPSTTLRVSSTSATTAPFGACASATTVTVPSVGSAGDAIDAKRSPELWGIVTTMFVSTRSAIDPGMYRTRRPSLTPAARPVRSTMTASRDASRTNVTVLCANAAAPAGALPFADTTVA
jgi:hypothetical protein